VEGIISGLEDKIDNNNNNNKQKSTYKKDSRAAKGTCKNSVIPLKDQSCESRALKWSRGISQRDM
jgi:hypothetical protein